MSARRNNHYRPGGFYRIDDRTGSKERASDTVKEWTGSIVHRDEFEPRHPQDFVRGKKDDQSVPDPRPEPIDQLIGPLTTEVAAAASAGANSIEVLDASRFRPGDEINFYYASGDAIRLTILNIIGNEFFFDQTLKGSVEAGVAVTNYTAVAPGYEG